MSAIERPSEEDLEVLRGQVVKKIPPLTNEAIERFFQRIEIDRESGCWVWPTVNHRGYGAFGFEGKLYATHRIAYVIAHGSIPFMHEIDHLCNNPPCCNPVHLEAVTSDEHDRRTASRRTHCRRGHLYSEYGFINSSGRRECRACAREMKLAWQRENRDKGVGLRSEWTHCREGHAFEGENLIIRNDGRRLCRACNNEAQRQRRARKKAGTSVGD